ncbi:hypothetical protein U1Q18_016113 [Sarracenia purpurea var. burkii]
MQVHRCCCTGRLCAGASCACGGVGRTYDGEQATAGRRCNMRATKAEDGRVVRLGSCTSGVLVWLIMAASSLRMVGGEGTTAARMSKKLYM